MDPNSARGEIVTLKHGRNALATWREYGIIHEVVEGVAIIVHSYAASPGESVEDHPDEIQRTAVPEGLIERIRVFTEEGNNAGGS